MVEETEVFRLDSEDFNKSKCYAFALRTRMVGSWPNEKYYTTNPLQYLGKHIRSEDWGSRDDHGGAETFDNNGIETRIVYDYEGLTCFKQVQCLDDMGMPIDVPVANPPMELCDMTFNCELMIDPVKASDGFTYERNDIEEWLQTHNTSPYHGIDMPNKRLTPDNEMRMRISEWQRQNPGYRGGKKSNRKSRKSRKNNRKNIKKSARKINRNL